MHPARGVNFNRQLFVNRLDLHLVRDHETAIKKVFYAGNDVWTREP